MKALEIIKCIRETDDEHSVKTLEGVFKFGFIFGIKKGYTNIIHAIRHEVPPSDVDESNKLWSKIFINGT